MKLKDLNNIFLDFTNVKLIVNGTLTMFQGYWCNIPLQYENYKVETIIPIKYPDNDKLAMASILIKYED